MPNIDGQCQVNELLATLWHSRVNLYLSTLTTFQQHPNNYEVTVPTQCSNMDWALEELLQQETYTNHVQANPNDKEDYIEALHQLLENHVINPTHEAPSSTTLLPPLLLPPGPRHEEVEDVPVLLSPPEGKKVKISKQQHYFLTHEMTNSLEIM